MPHKFDPKNMHKLNERLKLMPPGEILSMIDLREGDIFLDIGAGPGGFSIPAAAIVGDSGKVIALDISQEVLDFLSEKVTETGLKNIEIIRSEENDLKIPDQSGDIAFLCMVFHEATDPALFLPEVFHAIRPGGKIVIIEWSKIQIDKGPPMDDRLELEQVISSLQEAGFNIVSGDYLYDYFFFVTGTK